MDDFPKAIVPTDHVEPGPRRVRGVLAGQTVFDTVGALYVFEHPFYPQYYVPIGDVDRDVLVDEGPDEDNHRGPGPALRAPGR